MVMPVVGDRTVRVVFTISIHSVFVGTIDLMCTHQRS